MHDLEKLDAAIQDLETSSFDIKNIRAAYQELVEFGKSLDSMGSKIDVNNRTLSEIAAELRSEQGRISQLSERLAKENLELIEQNNAQMILRLDRYQSEAAEEMHKSFTLIGDKFDTSNATLSNNTEILRTEQERIAQLYKEQAKENLERSPSTMHR